MDDELKDIPGYEGRYGATRDGRIWSFAKHGHAGVWLRPSKNDTGYPIVVLMQSDGSKRTCRVHRLVALTWLPNPRSLPELNHKDSDRANANVANLEWCTRSHNVAHSYHEGEKVAHNSMPKEKLHAIRKGLAAGEKGKSIAARLGVPASTVSGINKGRLYAHQPGERNEV